MNKIFSKKSLTVFISSCILSVAIALACADSWDEEYGNSCFTPEVFVDSTYSPFFLSYQYYYSIGHDDEYNTRFNFDNTLQWSGYLNKGFIHEELAYLLQNASVAETDSAGAYVSGKSMTVPVAMKAFVLLKEKKDKKVIEFLNYLHYAKISEAFAVDQTPWWDRDTVKKISFDATNLNAALLDSYSKTKDAFLKERYWFQLERSYFFNGGPQKAIDLFSNIENMPHNQIYYRVLSYVAGAYYKLKKFSIANYYFSKVYDSCTELKMAAHFSFHPQEESDWKATLALCRDNNERATLWQMLGVFYADEKRAIREIYELDPKSEKLYLLLARAINKHEQKFTANPAMDNYLEIPLDTAANSAAVLHSLLESIASAGNTSKPWIWDLAAGYINTIDGNYALATSYYYKAEKILPQEKAAQAQLKLLALINKIAKSKIIDKKIENDLHADIDWLRMLDDKNTMPIPQFRYQHALQWLKQTFAARYATQGEFVKSECFVDKPTFYADNKKLAAMKSFLGKPGKSPYETMCDALSVMRLDDLFEYEAITATYADSIDDAIQKIKHAGIAGTKMLLGNPFNARIADCHNCDFVAVQKVKYSKTSFLKKLKELENNLALGKDVYNNALLLGNAFYNISHFGNGRVFYVCKILGEGHSDPMYIEDVFRKMLINMDVAIKYYSIAYKNAQNDEQKAKCQFLMAKCERNTWYNKNVYNKKDSDFSEDPMADFKSFSGFAELKRYPNTQYYKEVIKECGYFRSYLKK